MLQIIQNIDYLKDYEHPVFVVPIYPDEKTHPTHTTPSLVIIFSEDREPALFGIDHNELPLMFNTDDLNSLLIHAPSESIIAKKHELLHSGVKLKSLKDMDMARYLRNEDPYNFLEKKPFSILEMQRTFREYENVNRYVPMMVLLEYAQKIYDDNKSLLNEPHHSFYHNVLFDLLWEVEKNGLKVDSNQLLKFYPTATIKDGFVHCFYNPYTATSRCSNSFGGINFAALDRKSGVRNAFVSRFGDKGSMVMFDYDSFHLKLLGHKFNMSYVSHKFLTNRYWPGIEITPDVYERSKQFTFAKIYGSHTTAGPNADTDPFFEEVDKKQRDLLQEFEANGGWIKAANGRKIPVPDASKEKIFNYWIQDLEFFTMFSVIQKIVDHMNNMKSRLVLHTYDSFLFDFHVDEQDELKELKEIITQSGKYPVKVYKGESYGKMVKF